jgi:hypothetical protein
MPPHTAVGVTGSSENVIGASTSLELYFFEEEALVFTLALLQVLHEGIFLQCRVELVDLPEPRGLGIMLGIVIAHP